MRLRRFAITALAVLLPTLSAAAEKPSVEQDEDVLFEEAIRDFGYVSGVAYQCLPETEQGAHDRAVLEAYSGIARLFGTDRAFFYAAAFGAGTSSTIDRSQCPGYIEDFNAAMKRGKPSH